MIAIVSLLVLLDAALADEFQGEITAYGFTASSASTEPNAGEPETLTANELGFNVRGRLVTLDDRLRLFVDYRDREPIGGDIQNRALRRLYRAEAEFAIRPNTWTVGVGQFCPPSVTFLPVTGLRTSFQLNPQLSLSAFGGRRAITTSLENVPFSQVLPAAGASINLRRQKLQVTALGTFSEDEAVIFLNQPETYAAPSFLVSASGLPASGVTVGGQVAFAQRASYTVGPTWADFDLQVASAGLWNASGYAHWRTSPTLRMDYFFHHQRVGVYAAGDLGSARLDEPNFTDNRARVSAALGRFGWLKGDYRVRLRPEGVEQRYGLLLYGEELGIDGLYLRGRLYFDAVSFEDSEGVFDRTLWSASAGYRTGGLDLAAGGSFIERAVTPSSSRQADATTSPDLSPFTLQAQRIVFGQGYYSGEGWFAGLDVEYNVEDSEIRGLIQAGIIGWKEW
ncbi:MAG: hypothetical protein AAFV53_19210 [Myxococcota bacterium]